MEQSSQYFLPSRVCSSPATHHNSIMIRGQENSLPSNAAVCISLRKPWAAGIFAVLTGLCALLLLWQSIRIAGSEALAASMKLRNLERAASLWPGNPEFHYRIAILGFNLIDYRDADESLRQARLATDLGPLWVRYWAQLAWACGAAGDASCADAAMERISRLAPMDPEAVSLTANYFLMSGKPALALKQFGHLLQIDASRRQDVFRICEAAHYPTAQLQRVFTEAGPETIVAYISYLAGAGKPEVARDLWKSLVDDASHDKFPLTIKLANPYIDRLLQSGDGQQVENVRLDLLNLHLLSSESPVFNGGFEQPPSNAGFDWRTTGERYPAVDFQAGSAHSGGHSLRVDFAVPRNDAYLLAYQLLPLQPNSRYRLTAYVRSENITSDNGPRLQIYDPSCRGCLDVATESTVGTTPWHPIRVQFSTGPETRLGRLEIVRMPGQYFPRDITGTFWLDDVTLEREPGGEQSQEKP